jgi:hypothetical protein
MAGPAVSGLAGDLHDTSSVEIVLGRFSSVDRAALGFWNDRFHGLRSPSPREEAARKVPIRTSLSAKQKTGFFDSIGHPETNNYVSGKCAKEPFSLNPFAAGSVLFGEPGGPEQEGN